MATRWARFHTQQIIRESIMKTRDYIAMTNLVIAVGIIACWPMPNWESTMWVAWIHYIARFAAFFLFLFGLQGLRNGISREIDEKTKRT